MRRSRTLVLFLAGLAVGTHAGLCISPQIPQPSHSPDEVRQRIKSTLLVPDPLPPIHAETYGQFEPAAGVTAERVTYAAAYGLRVPAIVYRPCG